MTDKELIGLAAKAADMDVEWNDDHREWVIDNEEEGFFSLIVWNPLNNSTQAFNLAVKCNLWIGQHDDGVTVSDAYGRFKGALEEDYGGDPYAATRRAIVRAAAAIGETL